MPLDCGRKLGENPHRKTPGLGNQTHNLPAHKSPVYCRATSNNYSNSHSLLDDSRRFQHVFGLQGAGEPGENPRRDKENMQTQTRGSNLTTFLLC